MNENNKNRSSYVHAVCRECIPLRWWWDKCARSCVSVWYKTKKRKAEVELGYLRSPPALSAGPHMENQASGPLGTDVCSPLDSSQASHGGCAGTWPTHDNLQPQVIHTWNRGENNFCSSGEEQNKQMGKEKHSSCSCWQAQHVANT